MARQINRFTQHSVNGRIIGMKEDDEGNWVWYYDVAPYIKEVENTAPNKQIMPCNCSHIDMVQISNYQFCPYCGADIRTA